MGHEDVQRIAALIKRVAANRTVLMVEHNLAHPAVVEAYLGTVHA
jgi:ABC-type branched-subunit amino acid transport system ATPase component